MLSVRVAACLSGFLLFAPAIAEDWNQWRGADRDGVAEDSPPLIDSLPDAGLMPLWTSEPIKSAGQGGWGSPVVAAGRVYLFAHVREKVKDLPPPEFPALTEEEQAELSEEELAAYEKQRSEENKQRNREQFQYREFIHCFHADTGEKQWGNESESLYTQFPQSGSPTVVDGRLYLLGAGRRVRCIDAVSGEDLWEQTLPGEFDGEHYHSSLAVVDGLVIATADLLFGLSLDEGQIVWQSSDEQAAVNHSSPVIWTSAAGARLICNLTGGWTACFDPADGREIWRVKSEASVSTPVVAGDRLITYGNNRKAGLRCYLLSEDGAEEQWIYRGIQDKGSSPVVVGPHVYVQGETRIACVNLETGEAEWTDYLDLHHPQYTSLAAADGQIFYAYEALYSFRATPEEFAPLYQARFGKTGLMAAEETFLATAQADAESPLSLEERERLLGEQLGNPPLGCASPAIADGRIYLRLRDALACYDLRGSAGVAMTE